LPMTPETTSRAAAAPVEPTPAPIQKGFGTIRGRLVWGGASAPEPKVLIQKGDASVKDAQVCAADTLIDRSLAVDPETRGVAFGYAYLPRPTGTNPEATKALLESQPKVVLDQEFCEFIPYSL